MDIENLRKVEVDEIRRMPDGIRVYVTCNSEHAIFSNYFTGWYRKYADHVQNDNGFINLENPNFEFYVKFQYTLPGVQQILFDIATELSTGFSNIPPQQLAERIYNMVDEIDRMELWKNHD